MPRHITDRLNTGERRQNKKEIDITLVIDEGKRTIRSIIRLQFQDGSHRYPRPSPSQSQSTQDRIKTRPKAKPNSINPSLPISHSPRPSFISKTQLINAPHPPTPAKPSPTLRNHPEPIKALFASRCPSTNIPLLRTDGIAEPARATGRVTPAALAVCSVVDRDGCRSR